MRIRPIITIGLALTVASLAACGGGDDENSNADRFEGAEKQVAAVVDDLQSASREADTKTICREIFTADHATRVASGAGTSCESKAKQEIAVPDETIEVQGLIVKGQTATARVKEQTGKVSTLAFVKSDGAWRIDQIR
jgi:hypothetical protein